MIMVVFTACADSNWLCSVEEEDESAPKVQRRIAQMKALYKREKELEEDEADEDAFVEAVEESVSFRHPSCADRPVATRSGIPFSTAAVFCLAHALGSS